MGCHSVSEGASRVPNDSSVTPNSRSFKDLAASKCRQKRPETRSL
jgi:hypothetical protein